MFAMPTSLKVLVIGAVLGVASGAVVGVATVAGLAVPAAAQAASTAYPEAVGHGAPVVLSARATPSALPPFGGQVEVTGTVKHASSCQLEVLSRQSFPVVYSHNATTACRAGPFSAHVVIGPNPSAVKRTVAFALVARNGPYVSTGRFYVVIEPFAVPEVLSARATPSALAPFGGQVQVTGAVEHASSCQLELLSRQSFLVAYSHNPTTACRAGPFSVHVVIGPNPSAVTRTVAFALVARNGPYVSTGRFYVSLEPFAAPVVLSARATPSVLGPFGGQVQATGTVEHASSCQLELLSRQSFLVVYSHNPTTACRGGPFSVHVVIGPNPSAVTRTVAFALVARNGPYVSSGRFYVSIAPNAHPSPPPPPTPPPITVPGDPYVAGGTGYDVSWPQCAPRGSATATALPSSPSFAVVGVNNGTISGFNSCFDDEAAWAGPSLSVYIVLQPAPGGNPVHYESTGPEASCSAVSSQCEGYDWGWNYAEADIAFVTAQGISPKIWWLDIETAEEWPTSANFQPVNAAIIEGALAALKAAGDVAGIYCTWYQWGEITGSFVPSQPLPIWVAGATSLSGGKYSAQAYCARALSPGDASTLYSSSIGFAGGAPWLVQYGYGTSIDIDSDYSC
jgi:hypothetical protein